MSSDITLAAGRIFYVPGGKNVLRYTAHLAENGAIFHISIMSNGNVELFADLKGEPLGAPHVFNNIVGFHGIRRNMMFLRDRHNLLYSVTIIQKSQITVQEILLCSLLPPMGMTTCIMPIIYHLECGPYRAIREGSRLRINGLDMNLASMEGLVLNNFPQALDTHTVSRSVIHSGYLLLFFAEAKNRCKRVAERVIHVESPLLYRLDVSIPISSLVYARDDSQFVYMLVPTCRTLLIIEPGNLSVIERRLSFGDGAEMFGNRWDRMRMVGVSSSYIIVGIPEFVTVPVTGNTKISGYALWTGRLDSSSEETGGISKGIQMSSDTFPTTTNSMTTVPNFPSTENKENENPFSPNSKEDKLQKENNNLREENARLEKLVAEMTTVIYTIEQKIQKEGDKDRELELVKDQNRKLEKLVEEINLSRVAQAEENELLKTEKQRLERILEKEKWKVATMRLQLASASTVKK